MQLGPNKHPNRQAQQPTEFQQHAIQNAKYNFE